MKYNSVKEAIDTLLAFEDKLASLSQAMGALSIDAATAAPKASYEGRGKTMAYLSGLHYNMMSDPANEELIDYLKENDQDVDAVTRRKCEVLRRSIEVMKRIPEDEYVEYSVLLNESERVWEDAKNNSDFNSFAPYLEKIVDFNRKFAGYYNPNMTPYNALLNEFEEGLTTDTLDIFFSELRETIVPLVKKITCQDKIDNSFIMRTYPIESQRKFSKYLMETLGLDPDRCVITESEHPFTDGFNNRDVRITTHYYENDLSNSMYSVIHEGGHALYELGCADEYNRTLISGGAAMSIHESQSRFYENIIGRSEAFIKAIFLKAKELFPKQLDDVTAMDFYRAVNRAEPSFIRTEADELTYCLHIMVRYEIEKQLIAGTLKVADVPEEWNRLYKEYLGVDVTSDKIGCLQDSHWAGGAFGYFPSYALGSAYASQMYDAMLAQDPTIFDGIEKGDLSRVTDWLGKHIHRHASFYKANILFENCCGKFDPSHYTKYLKDKFTALYAL